MNLQVQQTASLVDQRVDASAVMTAIVVREQAMAVPMIYRSVGLSRIQARRTLTMWNWCGDIEDAVLVVSELVTNSINHARVVGELLSTSGGT